jgi:hypothetical protein
MCTTFLLLWLFVHPSLAVIASTADINAAVDANNIADSELKMLVKVNR